jgi:plastocyanin
VLKAVVILTAGLAGLAAAVVPAALAASQTVTAVGNTWDHSQVAIQPGDSVTFNNPAVGGGFHNLWIDGTQVHADGSNWSYTASGLSAGQHQYQCTLHGNMVGTIYVNDAATVPTAPPPTTTTAPPSTSTPTTSTSTTTTAPGAGGGSSTGGGSSGGGTSGGGSGPGASAGGVSLARSALGSFCVGGPGCRHPGVVVKLELAIPATVRLALKRSGHAAGTVAKALDAGAATLRFTRTSKGRLRAGRYRGAVTATPRDGDPLHVGNITYAIR